MKTHTPIPAGTRYHRLTVVEYLHHIKNRYFYRFKCDCGGERIANVVDVRRGQTASCGCLHRERMARMGRRTPIKLRLEGRRFGRWSVVRYSHSDAQGPLWLCRCDCGEERAVLSKSLTSGKSKSCGCLKVEKAVERSTRHGQARVGQKTREYRIWVSMVNRCHNPNNSGYKDYGARGIKVCDRWRGSFVAFRGDVGPIPVPLTIDRVDNDGDYEPGNVRLATYAEQARNRRPRRKNI